MKVGIINKIFLLLWSILLAGYEIEGSTYNYSASVECMVNPLLPQYDGGLLANPAFDNSLEGWNVLGNGKIEVRRCPIGNQFIVAYNRSQPRDSFSQQLYLEKGLFYTFSAWVRINEGNEKVVAGWRHSHNQTMAVGSIVAQSGCWSMLKGGFTVDLSMPADLYFETNNTSVELWVDNISLQPFTTSQWREHQSESIEKIRKRKLRIHVSNKQGMKLQGAQISIQNTRPHFPLGCAATQSILNNQAYQKWFTSRFTATTFENEMKWYFTEQTRWHEDYTVPDAMVKFFNNHRISVRGHNIFWDDQTKNPNWVQNLSSEELWSATKQRIDSIMKRYSGKVISWDVMNENLHFSFFENRLGQTASAYFYKTAMALDHKATMFLNDYNTLEQPEDEKATPAMYLRKLKEIRSFPGNGGMVVGIGVEAHFGRPNIPYMRASLDALAATKMPIWLTELDVKMVADQAEFLEEVMREAYSHPAVKGIILWSGWKPTGCYRMCLTDNNFNNLPAGDVVDKLIKEWKTKPLMGMTDDNGVYEHQIFHGEYLVTVFNPHTGKNLTRKLEVTNEDSEALNVRISI